MKLAMIDGIGPFFIGHPQGRINWSKIPFSSLERAGRVDRARFRDIRKAFHRFAETAVSLGFTAVSLDDLAHLTEAFCYSHEVRDRITAYREEFLGLFEIAREAGLEVYITTDIAYFNRDLDRLLGADDGRIVRFLVARVQSLFREFPQVAGLIVRFGESDGVDVKGDFLSRPVLRSAAQARFYFQSLLDVCEAHGRDLVVRTWSLGAYPLGDLIWNRRTYDSVFGGLRSSRLIISMKYGEADFFRHLPLCAHFHDDPDHRKIVELQARREYEGFGEYPSFVGWDYARYARELESCRNMAGIWVWSQTGGWTASRRITFVKDSPVWNEVNVWVTAGVFMRRQGVVDSVREYCRQYLPGKPAGKMVELLRLSSEVVKEGLYVEEYARRAVYFRRLRLPPLLHVFWDTVLTTGVVRSVMRHFVADPRAAIEQGRRTLEKIRRMMGLAESLGLPSGELESQYALFEILALAREYYFGRYTPALRERLRTKIREYRRRHPGYYTFIVKLPPSRLHAGLIAMGLRSLTRRRSSYRLADRLFLLQALAGVGWLLKFWPRERLPRLADAQGMGLRHFLK